LGALKRELLDVEINTDVNIEISSLVSFADYFFDGLIVDWVVQSQINEAKKHSESVMTQVEQIYESLRMELKETGKKARELQTKKQQLVENSEIR